MNNYNSKLKQNILYERGDDVILSSQTGIFSSHFRLPSLACGLPPTTNGLIGPQPQPQQPLIKYPPPLKTGKQLQPPVRQPPPPGNLSSPAAHTASPHDGNDPGAIRQKVSRKNFPIMHLEVTLSNF